MDLEKEETIFKRGFKMKAVLKFMANILLGAGIISAVVITCMMDSEGPVFDNIIRFYAISALLTIFGGLMTGSCRAIEDHEKIKYSDEKHIQVMFSK